MLSKPHIWFLQGALRALRLDVEDQASKQKILGGLDRILDLLDSWTKDDPKDKRDAPAAH